MDNAGFGNAEGTKDFHTLNLVPAGVRTALDLLEPSLGPWNFCVKTGAVDSIGKTDLPMVTKSPESLNSATSTASDLELRVEEPFLLNWLALWSAMDFRGDSLDWVGNTGFANVELFKG
jgi:hypothetical protein